MGDIIRFVAQPDRERPTLCVDGPATVYPFTLPGPINLGLNGAIGHPYERVQFVLAIRCRVNEGKARRDAQLGLVPTAATAIVPPKPGVKASAPPPAATPATPPAKPLRAPVLLLHPSPHPLVAANAAQRGWERSVLLGMFAYCVGTVLLLPDGPLLGAAMFAPPVVAVCCLAVDHFRSPRPQGVRARMREFWKAPSGVMLPALLGGTPPLGFGVIPFWKDGYHGTAIVLGLLAVAGAISDVSLFRLFRSHRSKRTPRTPIEDDSEYAAHHYRLRP